MSVVMIKCVVTTGKCESCMGAGVIVVKDMNDKSIVAMCGQCNGSGVISRKAVLRVNSEKLVGDLGGYLEYSPE